MVCRGRLEKLLPLWASCFLLGWLGGPGWGQAPARLPPAVSAQPPADALVLVLQPLGEEKPTPLPQPRTLIERLQLPGGIPGGNAPIIKLPPPTAPRKELEAAINRYFPPLPPLSPMPGPLPGPQGRPLRLTDLEQMTQLNSPVIRQASAEVAAARGAAVQAGLYPNPVLGYEADTIGQASSPGLQGGFLEQTIKTAGKLKLARAAAMQDVRLAELKLRQTQIDVLSEVRTGYFNVLVAQKKLEVMRSLALLTDEVYLIMVAQLKAGEVATYEPMQLRVLALQARALAIQAHNRYLAAWKQLAAAMGLADMPLTELAGQIDMPIPRYNFEAVLAQMLNRNTEMLAAVVLVDKAQVLLRLAQVTPIPDLDVRLMTQHDHTTPPYGAVTTLVLGAPIPVWNRNQGQIREAQAHWQRAEQEASRVRNDLSGKLAQAFERYESNRLLLEMYNFQMLPDQVRAFRATVIRHARGGDKAGSSYNDLVVAEQSLVNVLDNYLNILREQWDAVVDIAQLLQSDDLFAVPDLAPVGPLPDLGRLLPAWPPAAPDMTPPQEPQK